MVSEPIPEVKIKVDDPEIRLLVTKANELYALWCQAGHPALVTVSDPLAALMSCYLATELGPETEDTSRLTKIIFVLMKIGVWAGYQLALYHQDSAEQGD